MPTVVYPLPMNEKLARQITQGAKDTGLSQAELMRQALAFGLPQVIEALRKPAMRLTSVAPLPASAAKALYRLKDDDSELVGRLIAAQSFPSKD
jgi:hypothetical protein